MSSLESPQDRRARILKVARASFGARGYTGTTTRSIAAAARVSEPLLFRYFGSKELLFEEAVLEPFTSFVTSQVADWQSSSPGSRGPLDEAARIYNRLVDLFVAQQPVLSALLAVYHYEEATPNVADKLEKVMGEIVEMLEERASMELQVRRNESVDIPTFVRMMIGMAFAVVATPGLFASGAISRQRLVREMTLMTIYGTRLRPQLSSDELAGRVGLESGRELLPDRLEPSAPGSVHRPRGSALDDVTWPRIASVLDSRPFGRTGKRQRANDRRALDGLVQVLVDGEPWRSIEVARVGVSGTTCWRRMRAWQDAGVWPRIVGELRQAGFDLRDPSAG